MFNIVLIQLAPTNFGGYAFFKKEKKTKSYSKLQELELLFNILNNTLCINSFYIFKLGHLDLDKPWLPWPAVLSCLTKWPL